MENFQFDNGYDTEGNYAPHCHQCRENGYDNTNEFVDLCDSCQDSRLMKLFLRERQNAVSDYIVDNA